MEFIDLKTQYSTYKESIDKAIHAVLDAGNYILGSEVAACEKALAAFCGAKHCITAASGTDTLMMALMAKGIGPGDEVITTPFTWISPVEMIALLGATPIFVDIDATLNIDPALVERAITKRTKAIMPVGLFGIMPPMEALRALAKKHQLTLIEDAAQCFGSRRGSDRSCSASEIASTSFFPAKPLGCYGDGGALFTDNDELAATLRVLRVHGGLDRNNFVHIGINGRFDTLQAAVINAKLPHFAQEIERREESARYYTKKLSSLVQTPVVPEDVTSTWAMYTIRHPERDAIAAHLKTKGIPTGIYYPKTCYEHPAYAYLGVKRGACPVAERASKEVLSIPMHAFLKTSDQDKVVEAIQESLCLTKRA